MRLLGLETVAASAALQHCWQKCKPLVCCSTAPLPGRLSTIHPPGRPPALPTHLQGLSDLEAEVVCRDGRLHNLTCTQQQHKSAMHAALSHSKS